MITALGALRSRLLAGLGRLSMYRLVLLSLAVLAVLAFGVSFTGQTSAQPLALVMSAAVLTLSVGIVDVIGHRVVKRPLRMESGLITALILLFVLFPTTDPAGLGMLALAGAAASASKFLLVWRGRHIFNPAAFGAAAVTLTALTGSMWWIGSPLFAGAVIVLGVLVALRAEKLRVAVVFIVVAIAVSFVRTLITVAQFGLPMTPLEALSLATWSSPVLFAAFFMVTEPLTLPARRGHQLIVAVVAGVLVGWPLAIGSFVVLPEAAILLANIVAFALAFRSRRGTRLTVAAKRTLTPTIEEVAFVESLPFTAGQYVELELAHRRTDARGSRREFSIVSAPGENLRIAYRVPTGRMSSFKTALTDAPAGADVHTTGIHGDFTLPTSGPLLLVAAGIGVTPFVSHVRAHPDRDAVLVYVVSGVAELAYRDELAASGARVIVVAPDAAETELPAGWSGFAARVNAETLPVLVPDLASRHALISGPPRLIAELAPALRTARSVHTDAFAGY